MDANGKPVEREAEEPSPSDALTRDSALPDGFAHRSKLEAAGVKTVGDLLPLTRDALIAMPGIGEKSADEILTARDELTIEGEG